MSLRTESLTNMISVRVWQKHFVQILNIECSIKKQQRKQIPLQESPPAWTQEAYRPPCSDYSFCCPNWVPPHPDLAGGVPCQGGYPTWVPPILAWGDPARGYPIWVPPILTWPGGTLPGGYPNWVPPILTQPSWPGGTLPGGYPDLTWPGGPCRGVPCWGYPTWVPSCPDLAGYPP